jgi:nucleotide-binding universal stress UspA family protein
MNVVVGKDQIRRYYEEEGEARLVQAKKKLYGAHIPYRPHVLVGPIAETIVEHAKGTRCDLIFIGSRGLSELGKALLGSTATKVLHLSGIPVLLVK